MNLNLEQRKEVMKFAKNRKNFESISSQQKKHLLEIIFALSQIEIGIYFWPSPGIYCPPHILMPAHITFFFLLALLTKIVRFFKR